MILNNKNITPNIYYHNSSTSFDNSKISGYFDKGLKAYRLYDEVNQNGRQIFKN